MKKLLPILALLIGVTGNAQCPPPTDLTYETVSNPNDVIFSWTENGDATTWEITVVPDFTLNTSWPVNGTYISPTTSFVIASAPITSGCHVYFVRSICSSTEQSSWVGIGTSYCSAEIQGYLATLSNQDFKAENNAVQLFPNPAQNSIRIAGRAKIEAVL
ncbi:hypothetical protein CHU92_10970 [Flavobacterium cyanobacteriorum]|uniref:Fibronectin type-III domain-containing protein n=1 Tax=Flavobacterium cyanobacteriorum TaxID=2022802 RepID=A0A255Z445_9FLAO|nr:hypothetical protein CHU92_10970 [Flavobacterium cyanobacteriorum]